MRLTDAEQDRLTIFLAAELARRRRAAGLKLNYPEALALISDEVLEQVRAGRSYQEVTEYATQVLTRDDVMDGVPEMLALVQLEGMFEDGTKLITLRYPIQPSNTTESTPGRVLFSDEPVALNDGLPSIEVRVRNTAAVPIQVSSHYHFFEANRLLAFDRSKAYGMRLDVPAGGSVRFAPGETRVVQLVPLRGERRSRGFSGLVDGTLDETNRIAGLQRLRDAGYLDEPEL